MFKRNVENLIKQLVDLKTLIQRKWYSNTIRCYGCNAPGVIGAKCTNCNKTNQDNTAESNLIQFHQINLPGTSSEYVKPLLSVTINGFYGVGIADSGAQVSIAGHELYKLLHQQGQTFTPTKARLSYANGEVKEEDLLKTSVEVIIKHKTFPVEFLVLPHAGNNKTLLGVDFLRAAEITLDIANRCWYFSNDTKQKFYFMNEQTSHNDCEIRISSLRVDEGEKLSADQRPKLDTLLNENEDIFQPGGGPTTFAVHRINTKDHATADMLSRPFEFPSLSYEEVQGEDIQEATRCSESDYVMNNGVLYHYNQDAEDPQLVVPTSMRVTIMKEYHDAPTADLVGPLPETTRGNNWVLIVKDTASKWTELFAIQTATAEASAKILIDEVFLRYGTPKKIISDNGVQFVSHVMQQVTYCFDINTPFIPYYHPEIVLLKSHSLSDAKKGYTSKFAPKRDGPYKVLKTITPTTHELGTCALPSQLIGRYHVSDIWAYYAPLTAGTTPEPVGMKRRRRRPKKMSELDNAQRPTRCPEGESVTRQDFETRTTRERRLPGWMRNCIREEEEELSM
ncbi:hypothetical protein Trydic_g9183 [Trypoxylus dichotomus]